MSKWRWIGVPFLLKTYKEFESDRVNELHAKSLISLGDQLHYFTLISMVGTIFLADLEKQKPLIYGACAAFFIGVFLKNYAFQLVQQLEAKELRKERFGQRKNKNG